MSTNTLVALQVKAYIQSFSSSLLYCVFLDQEHSQLLLHFCSVIEGDAFYHADLSEKPRVMIRTILNAKNEYVVDTEAIGKVLDAFIVELKEKPIASLFEKHKEKNTGAIDFFLKKVVDHAFQIDDSKIIHDMSIISHGEIEHINALERVESLTVAQRYDIAKKYIGRDSSVIKDVVDSGREDTVIALFTCEKGGAIVAAASLIFNRVSGRLLRCAAVSGNLPNDKFSASLNPVDLYHSVDESYNAETGALPESKALQKKLETITRADLAKALADDDPSRFSVLITNTVKGALSFDNLNVHLLSYNCVIADIIFNPPLNSAAEEDTENDPTAKIPAIAVDLALSPTKGVKLSELQPGNRIYVIINASNPMGRKIVSQLNLMDENNRVKPVGGVVESVTRDKKNNFVVLVRLSSKLLGRAIEEEDIKVKSGDPVADRVIKKSSSMLIVGLITGFFVIVIIAAALLIFL